VSKGIFVQQDTHVEQELRKQQDICIDDDSPSFE